MVRKDSKGTPANGNEKNSKGFRNQFWSINAPIKENDKGETEIRPESAVSRQFLPKKQQGTSDAWTKQIQENQDEQKQQPFNYTPFKSGQISRAPSTSALRGGTPNPQDILQPNLLLQSGFYNSQFQRPASQQSQNNPYQIYSGFLNNRDIFSQNQNGLKPIGQITKTADKSRTSLTAIPRPEAKGQLKGLNSFPPPPGPYRPASAMNAPMLQRPTSRANSDIGFINEGLESRYQSYTTLPRPEYIEFDHQSNHGSEFIKLSKQMSLIYNPYLAKPVNETQSYFAESNPANQTLNRPASVMLAGAPGMASDYLTAIPSLCRDEPELGVPLGQDSIIKFNKDLVFFGPLSLLSSFLIICALTIMTCGILRLNYRAKYGFGIELCYAVVVFVTGIIGIYASSKRSHRAAIATFSLSAFNAFFAIFPLFIGIFPLIANFLPNVDVELQASNIYSTMVNYLMSFTAFITMVLSLIETIYGCQAVGDTITHVEMLRFRFEESLTPCDASILPSKNKITDSITTKQQIN